MSHVPKYIEEIEHLIIIRQIIKYMLQSTSSLLQPCFASSIYIWKTNTTGHGRKHLDIKA